MRFSLFILSLLWACTALSQPVANPSPYEKKLNGVWKLTTIEKQGSRQDLVASGYTMEFLVGGQLKQKSGDSPEKTLTYKIAGDTLRTDDGRTYVITKVSKKQLILYRMDTEASTIFIRPKQ